MPEVDLLLVADSLEGGLGLAVRSQVEYFRARGWRIGVAAPPGDASRPACDIDVEIQMPRSGADLRDVLRAAAQLRRELRRLRPRLIHAHGLRSQLVALAAGRRPWVTRHGGGPMSGLPAHVAAARAISTPIAPLLARRALSVSPAAGRWRTIVTASPKLRSLTLAPLHAMEPEPLFLWVGRLDAPKRPDIFVDAVAAVSRTSPCRGVIVGAGPLRDSLQAQIARLGAPVSVVGHQADLQPWFARAWAVCLFSEFEGLPFTVEEAMWCGRAVVASDLPGVRWFAGDAVVYADTAADAAAALSRLTARAEAERRGEIAADVVRRRVSVDAPYPELERLYADAGVRPSAGEPG